MEQDRERSNVRTRKIRHNPLTEREYQVLVLAADGRPSNEIARSLGITKRTVTFHLSSAYRKLGARSRRQAVEQARKMGLLDLGE